MNALSRDNFLENIVCQDTTFDKCKVVDANCPLGPSEELTCVGSSQQAPTNAAFHLEVWACVGITLNTLKPKNLVHIDSFCNGLKHAAGEIISINAVTLSPARSWCKR